MTDLQKTLEAYIDEHADEAISYLQQLIQQPSVQTNERGVQEIVIEKLNRLGLEVDIWDPVYEELAKSPYFVASRDTYVGSPNVVGVLKGQGGGKSIIYNGHIDVVPEGDRGKWTDDPFSGKIENGKMYGRGTTDMKGGNVALLLAIEAVIKSGTRLKGDVIFQSVIEEESGGVGTLAAVLRGYTADAAIIPEPTNMKLFIKQQGSMWFRVTVEGRSAHGGTRYEGVSAIEQAIKVHQSILALEKKRNASIDDPLYSHIPIPLPINVGSIKGGSWPSSVPDLVTMEGRMGVGPHENMQEVKKELIDHLANLCAADDWLKDHPVKVEFFGAQWVPNAVETDHPFAELMKENFEAIYERKLKIEASPWGTDAGLLGKVGNIPSLVIGPGETKMAHYPNEFIEIKEVIQAAKLFALTLTSWCGVASTD
ncbi:peptidase [uncultured Imperialibacter sp.]|uniref:peptidase n=1 Tax=uncultured Imperialibacter sp. TaxID=1672639 RepID=UPI0030D84A91|tara:strand:- start:172977 stop:174251 length:1275 start_codon:yes stop_codon:yes gene_type:complete